MPETTTLDNHSWFLIMCSWEPDADVEAQTKFRDVYGYLEVLKDDTDLKKYITENPNDPLCDLDSNSFKALNLIGRRQFVMIGQAKSNKLQQKLALDIGLGTHIKVEVFPATFVHDLYSTMP